MSQIRLGQVYWLDFGAANGSPPADRHTCLVVQNDIFNQSAIATTVVCLIASNLNRANAPGNVSLRKGEANLPKASVVNISRVLTIDKSDLVDFVGSVPAASPTPVSRGLSLLFDVL